MEMGVLIPYPILKLLLRYAKKRECKCESVCVRLKQ